MSKTYLIEAEKAEWQTHDDLLLQKADGKEVEVLNINHVIVESATEGIRLHECIKANNLLIVKIKE